nr:hypothetical protein [Nocardiopsis sp. ATB16-24]
MSSDSLARRVPSGDHATPQTASVCPVKTAEQWAVGKGRQQGTAYDRSRIALLQGDQGEQDGQPGVFLHPGQDVFGDGERHAAQEPVVAAPGGVDEGGERRGSCPPSRRASSQRSAVVRRVPVSR